MLSPAKKVVPLFVPLSPRRPIGTVPVDKLDAFNDVKLDPLPEKFPEKLVADNDK